MFNQQEQWQVCSALIRGVKRKMCVPVLCDCSSSSLVKNTVKRNENKLHLPVC